MGEKLNRVSFTKRAVAFIIDVLIVYVVAITISSPFINEKSSKKYLDEVNEIRDKFVKNEISREEYVNQFASISYKSSRATGMYSIINIFLELLYFIYLPFIWHGQTLGKKIMKIRVKSDDGDLTMNQIIFRSFIANFILLNIITFVCMLFSPKNVYFYVVGLFEMTQYLIVFVSIIMVLYRKDGRSIHDFLTHTRVVNE